MHQVLERGGPDHPSPLGYASETYYVRTEELFINEERGKQFTFIIEHFYKPTSRTKPINIILAVATKLFMFWKMINLKLPI